MEIQKYDLPTYQRTDGLTSVDARDTCMSKNGIVIMWVFLIAAKKNVQTIHMALNIKPGARALTSRNLNCLPGGESS